MELYYSVKEAARILRVSEQRIRKMCSDGKMLAKKEDGKSNWLIPDREVNAHVKSRL